ERRLSGGPGTAAKTGNQSGGGLSMQRLLVVLVVAGALAAVAPALAGGPTAVTCGSVITSPGDYYLASDCTGDGIIILASDVRLRLDGHTMNGELFGFSGVLIFGS